MLIDYVDCDNCGDLFEVSTEDENCGEGDEHEFTCPLCKAVNRVESTYNHSFHTLDSTEPPQQESNDGR